MNRTLFLATVLSLQAAAFLSAEDSVPSRDALEAKFKATMANATMAGKSIPLKDGGLGTPRDDSYTIVSAEKQAGDVWVINAKFKEAVVPIPVKVQWAGDTAVIVVDNLQMPGKYAGSGSSYTARVLIHEHTYAGSWSGGDHGGLISGTITNR
jgi:hypothetical protein